MTESVQKLRREESTTVIWTLKGWDRGERSDVSLKHLDNASCFVDVGQGATDGSQVARLRFHLEKGTRYPTVIPIDRAGVPHPAHGDTYYFYLYVEQLYGNSIAEYRLQCNLVDEQLQLINGLAQNSLDTLPNYCMEQNGREYEYAGLDFNYFAPRRPKTLRIKLFVSSTFTGEAMTFAPSLRFNQVLDRMLTFTPDQGYGPVIKLRTKDGETLGASQLFLAARSPILRDLIGKKMDKSDFNGAIKLDVDAKPMKVILHWIYSGKLPMETGDCMRAVVKAGKKFCVEGLLDTVDKMMIKFCNPQNMLILHQIALKYYLGIATVDISKFIRDNSQ